MDSFYHYTESGLGNVWLDGVETRETPHGPATFVPDLDGLHEAIGRNIARSNRQMTGDELRFLRGELDLSQAALARVLGVQENTVRRWEQGSTIVPGPVRLALCGIYLETISGRGEMGELMRIVAETDRQVVEAEIRLKRLDEDQGWVETLR